MKKTKLNKKLTLNKATVSHLNWNRMEEILGGREMHLTEECTEYVTCKANSQCKLDIGPPTA
ncbi:MAG: hypothetical protein GY765_34045 [bacterium]|nr:hypothetical protein [bacterium]